MITSAVIFPTPGMVMSRSRIAACAGDGGVDLRVEARDHASEFIDVVEVANGRDGR